MVSKRWVTMWEKYYITNLWQFTPIHMVWHFSITFLTQASLTLLSTYFKQKLGDLKVTIWAGIVKRNQATAGQDIRVKCHILWLNDKPSVSYLKKCLTLCPWHEHQLHAGEGAERCAPGCSRQPGGGASTEREDSLLADTDGRLV